MTVTFLPAATTGVSALSRDAPTEAADRPAITINVTATESPGGATGTAEARFQLLGPGDLLGFAESQVIRTEPTDGATGVETSLFASVDLDLPTLPWLVTTTGDAGRLLPWIRLVVLPDGDSVTVQPDVGRLTVAHASDLPDPADAWAWAHVQFTGELPTGTTTGTTTGSAAAAALGDPVRSVARLLCPRVLAPNTHYTACVVPVWESGRIAGLGGTPVPGSPLVPAWSTSSTEPVVLPVYHRFGFTTGDAGDFVSLVKALAGSPAWTPDPAGPAGRTLRVTWVDEGGPRSAELSMPSVLTLPGWSARPGPGADPTAWLRSQVLDPTTEGGTARLLPPLPGSVQAGYDRRGTDHAEVLPAWLDQLAVDARLRVAAAWGTQVVTEEREALVASAFSQLGAVTQVNAQRSRAQLARAVGDSQLRRHLSTGTDQQVAQLLGPQASRIPLNGGSLATVLAAVDPAVPQVLSAARRRMARANGPVARHRRVDPPRWAVPGRTPAKTALVPPAEAVARRVLGDFTLLSPDTARAQAQLGDKLRAFALPVSYATAMLAALLRTVPDAVLPGAGSIPANTGVLLRDDPAVVAAYLVGLNAEVQRLLQWRSVPVDRRATPFTSFWSEVDRITPIRDWDPGLELGRHANSHGVLAIRAELFRRYPATGVLAVPARSTQPSFVLDPATVVSPRLVSHLPPDIRLFVFDVPAAELRGDGSPGSGYYIVFQEQNSETRFGSRRLSPRAPRPGQPHWTLDDVEASKPNGGPVLSDSAAVASVITEAPAMVAVHATRFLANPTAVDHG